MAKSLIDRIRAARQTTVESNGKTFIVRRPTLLEIVDMRGKQINQGEVITRFVVGWGGFNEIDLVPGGGPEPVPFEPVLFSEYIADHAEHWEPIVNAVLTSYQDYQAKTEDSLKNSTPGSVV